MAPDLTFNVEKIRTLREGLGWSQQEFADRLGVTKQAVSLWETGEVMPNVASLLRIVNVTGAKLESFFAAGATERRA